MTRSRSVEGAGESAPSRLVRRIAAPILRVVAPVRRTISAVQDRLPFLRPDPLPPVDEALDRATRVFLALLVLAPTAFIAWNLLPELTIRTPNVNDDSVHFLFIQQASWALDAGQSLFDHWDPQFEAGVPQFLYYQHLPAIVVIAIQRLSFGALDLLGAFNLTRYLLMVAFPLTVFVAMRWMRFSTVAAAIAAAASTLLSTNYRYGFDLGSYTFAGFGLFTQLWAMHLSFLAVAAFRSAIHEGRRVRLAAILAAALILSHLVYAYMMAIGFVVIWLWGVSRTNVRARLVRGAFIGGFSLLATSYMWLPFLANIQYLNATPYLQPEKYDSYGAGTILGWVFSGDFLDHGRAAVLTVLLGAGIVAVLAGRARAGRLVLGLLAVWLLIYFGRPTLGSIVDLLPLAKSLLLHRFVGPVNLAMLPLIGVGGAAIWGLFRPARAHRHFPRLALATLAVAAFLVPAVIERVTYLDFNTTLKVRTAYALANDADAAAVIARIRTLPAGRVFAGLPATYGKSMAIGDVYFYNLLAYYAVEALPPPNESFSLNSDYIWDFTDTDPADYELWNVRYVIAPADRQMADFLTPIFRTGKYTLYQARTTGYAMYVTLTVRQSVRNQADLFTINRAWERSVLPSARQYARFDFPAAATDKGVAQVVPGCPDGGRTDYELFAPGKINLVTDCAIGATLVIKTSYHPNWTARVDGQTVPTFMVSPSYIGITMPAGRHTVDVIYQPTPIKTPLQLLGLVLLLLVVVGPGPLGRLAGRLGLAVPPRDGASASGRRRRERRVADLAATSSMGPTPRRASPAWQARPLAEAEADAAARRAASREAPAAPPAPAATDDVEGSWVDLDEEAPRRP